MKILVVDDHALIRDALRGVLSALLGSDATVLEAVRSSQALELVAENPDIELVLLDLLRSVPPVHREDGDVEASGAEPLQQLVVAYLLAAGVPRVDRVADHAETDRPTSLVTCHAASMTGRRCRSPRNPSRCCGLQAPTYSSPQAAGCWEPRGGS